jgi:hypothetical protein
MRSNQSEGMEIRSTSLVEGTKPCSGYAADPANSARQPVSQELPGNIGISK